jgi:hypothetical protein
MTIQCIISWIQKNTQGSLSVNYNGAVPAEVEMYLFSEIRMNGKCSTFFENYL